MYEYARMKCYYTVQKTTFSPADNGYSSNILEENILFLLANTICYNENNTMEGILQDDMEIAGVYSTFHCASVLFFECNMM